MVKNAIFFRGGGMDHVPVGRTKKIPITMEMKDTTKGLRNLAELLMDSRKGYQEAADRAEAPHLKQLLMKLSNGRTPLITEVESQLRMLGEDDMPKDGTLKGDLHRAWIDIRDALSGSDNAGVLAECERGEKYLLERYDELINESEVAESVKSMLNKQRTQVQSNINEVQALHATHEASEKNK